MPPFNPRSICSEPAARSLSLHFWNMKKRKGTIMWTTPAYTDINMSAEIGAYQDDFEERTSVLYGRVPPDNPPSEPSEA
jgi:hypothetical protein